MELKLVLIAIFISPICLTRSLASVYRNEFVELGTTVTLKCSNTKIAWNDMIFVIWKIPMRDTYCIIAVAKNDSDHDTCHDGKKQNHTADGTYHLIIPKFSVQDEGNYTCDTSYQAGGSVEIIRVSAWARPHLTGWLENEGGHTVAVCEATGKPAASIYWETPWNSSSSITQTSKNTGQLSTVISRLCLPQNTSYKNLICVATANDAMHTVTRFSNFTFTFIDTQNNLALILGVVLPTIVTVFLLFVLYLKCKNHMPLSIFRKICCKLDKPATNEEKPQQPCDPEELEPYASYVQRVNSIYNSSADLFKA
ncbi:cell surface glycoprotein CD200 receptor 1-A-like isoform X2 [Hemibagrus wyckioides]|uniref:cell surface glycoprotein CD200 receptor 1-A-like isoform X2 n=1 Tax=Hemibagrus wyckioides TaxID=337641 RepID=UPI00266B710A|nr:cell surface glycoprotein CD200 receptor 1-A-like isoform X2 [Hemibagrus wyckioides]